MTTTLPCHLASVRTARRFARDALYDENDALVELVELLVSEVVTNAIRHARSGCRLNIGLPADEVVHVEVHDSGPGFSPSREVQPDGHSGRGLLILEELSHRWGHTPLAGGGTCVWFDVVLPSHRAHPTTDVTLPWWESSAPERPQGKR